MGYRQMIQTQPYQIRTCGDVSITERIARELGIHSCELSRNTTTNGGGPE